MHYKLSTRVIGFILCLALTFVAYWIMIHPSFGVPAAILTLFILALVQAFIQLVCFINVWKEKGIPWNLNVFLSTVSIIFIIIFFSFWIINHLNENMQ